MAQDWRSSWNTTSASIATMTEDPSNMSLESHHRVAEHGRSESSDVYLPIFRPDLQTRPPLRHLRRQRNENDPSSLADSKIDTQRSPLNQLLDISSTHSSPYTQTLDSFDHSSPILYPSADPSLSHGLGLGHYSLNDSQNAAQNFYSPGHSPAISPRLMPQQNELPAFTADNNFGMVPAMSGQFGQPDDDFFAHATNGSTSSFRRSSDALLDETRDRHSHQTCQSLPDATLPYQTEFNECPAANEDDHQFTQREIYGQDGQMERYDHVLERWVPWVPEEWRDTRDTVLLRLSDTSHNAGLESSATQRVPAQVNTIPVEVDFSLEAAGHEFDVESPTIQAIRSLNIATSVDVSENEDRENGGRSGNTITSLSSAAKNITLNNKVSDGPQLTMNGLSQIADDLPLSSQTSAAIFRDAYIGLGCLLLDLQYFDGDTEVDQSVTSGDDLEPYTPVTSGVTSELEDGCDEGQDQPFRRKGRQAGSREASDSTPPATGAGEHEHDGPGRKRQRIDNDSEDRSRAIVKTKREKPGSDREQMLICCFRNDSHTPCLGTDKSICDVIDRLASSHHIFVCKTCYVLLVKNDSGEKVHPDGIDCVAHCLSPRCLGDLTTTACQRHRFNAKSCGTKTGRPRPEDREIIYRYIFQLVHPTRDVPANVFTTGKTPHLGMVPRQGNRKPTRDELESQFWELSERFEELRKRDSASTNQIEVLTRNLETERTNNTNLEEKMQRLEDIIADAIRPGALSDDHWRRSILQRLKRDAPDVLGHAPTQPQTPPESLHDSQKPNTVPAPHATGATGQHQPFWDVSLQAPSNNTTNRSFSKALGKRPATELMPGPNLDGFAFSENSYLYSGRNGRNNAPTMDPSEMTIDTGSASALSEIFPGLGAQRCQDTPSGGLCVSRDQAYIELGKGCVSPNLLQDQASTGNWWGDGSNYLDEGSSTMRWPPTAQF